MYSGGPTDYGITERNEMSDYTGPGGHGPKPSGMICVDGVLYLASQNLLGTKQPAHGLKSQHGSDAQIICSTDHGAYWVPQMACFQAGRVAAPMFPDHKSGGPAFINFGQDNAHARDAYVYAISTDQLPSVHRAARYGVPVKWMESDGVTGWIQFSGSWGRDVREKLYYRSNLHRFRLKMR
jgi:hypothetical protein